MINKLLKLIGTVAGTSVVVAYCYYGNNVISDAVLPIALALLVGILVIEKVVPSSTSVISLLIFFVPFERVPSISVGGADVRINTFVGLLAIALVAIKLFSEKMKLRPYPAALWLIPFFGTATVGIAYAGNVGEGVKVFLFSLFTMLLSVAVVQFVRSKEDLVTVLKWLLPSAILVVLFAFYQTAGDIVGLPGTVTLLKLGYGKATLGFPRPQSFSMEPLYLANYLFLPLGIFAALWLGKVKGWSRKTLGLLLLGILLAIVLTVSRGAYLALVPFALVFAVMYTRHTISVRTLGTLAVSIVLIGASAGAFLSYSRPDAIEQFVAHATLQDLNEGESTQGRLQAFDKAIVAWRSAPMFGIGMGNFGPYIQGYPNPAGVSNWDIVNNEYLELLAETGVVGLTCFGMFILAIIWRQIRAIAATKDELLQAVLVGLLATFIGVLVQYNFFSTLYIIYIWVLIGLMVATQNVVLVTSEEKRRK